MLTTEINADQVKHHLRLQGMTLKDFAQRNNFKYRDVSDVVRGVRRGKFGAGRTIVELLKKQTSGCFENA